MPGWVLRWTLEFGIDPDFPLQDKTKAREHQRASQSMARAHVSFFPVPTLMAATLTCTLA